MKLIVFSDSHGELRNMLQAVEKETPQMMFHLGDVLADAEELHKAFPELPMERVPGNCDGWRAIGEQEERLTQVAGVNIFYLHGHTVRVKLGFEDAVRKAAAAGAGLLLFGHTHRPVQEERDGLWLLNPGSVREGCYATVELEEGKLIRCSLKIV